MQAQQQSTLPEKGNPSANRPEESAPRAKAPSANAREVVRERCPGSVGISVPGGFPRQAKCIDVSHVGVSVTVELPIPMGKVYDLHIKAFRNGRSFEITAKALCVHCTLSGRDFKAGFKFGPLSDVSKSTLDALLKN